MSRFPVSAQRDINEIVLTEGIPFGLSKKDTVSSPTNGTNIQDFVFTSGSGSYPLRTWATIYFTKLRLVSSRDVYISIRVDNAGSNKFAGVSDNTIPNGYVRLNINVDLKAGVPYDVDNNQIQMFGYMPNISFVCRDTVGTAVTLETTIYGYQIGKNTNIGATRQLLWVGDSISNGTGSAAFENVPVVPGVQSSTTNQEPFTQQVKKSLIYKGYDFWLTNKAQSSMTTSSIVQAIKWGYYDNTTPELVIIQIGANDANNLGSGGLSVTANQTLFLQNVTFINAYFTKRFSNAKVLWLGSTPSADNTTEDRIVISRGIISAYITGLSNPNIKYSSLAAAFDRTNTSNYLEADTIHPTAQNSIAGAISNFINTTGWYD
jgi:lysophospholipase L1-like esterase